MREQLINSVKTLDAWQTETIQSLDCVVYECLLNYTPGHSMPDTDTQRQNSAASGQSNGERGGTEFPHLLFLVYTVPPPEFEGYALSAC